MGEMHNAIGSGSPSINQKNTVTNAQLGSSGGMGLTQAIPNLEEELSIDKNTMETMKALYAAKERAVQMEDFEEAKRLKETIERLKTVSGHIS